MSFVIIGIISFVITYFLEPKILLLSMQKRLIDKPSKRKIHHVISSRLGGVCFFPAIIISTSFALSVAVFYDRNVLTQDISVQFILGMAACFIMYIVGIFDDIVSLRYRQKFFFQTVASLIIVAAGIWLSDLHGFLGIYKLSPFIGVPLTLLMVVFITNALNLIDGIDGLASGLALIASALFGISCYMHGNNLQASICFALCGVLLAFMRFNLFGFPGTKLRMFMGDTGSLTIGTLLSVTAFVVARYPDAYNDLGFSGLLLAYSVLLVPCFDVLRVMIVRLRNGKSPFLPDKNHIHHKLLAIGLSSRQSLGVILLVAVAFDVLNVALNMIMPLELVLVIGFVIYWALNVLLDHQIEKRQMQMRLNVPRKPAKMKKVRV